jgi:hypothetical protein
VSCLCLVVGILGFVLSLPCRCLAVVSTFCLVFLLSFVSLSLSYRRLSFPNPNPNPHFCSRLRQTQLVENRLRCVFIHIYDLTVVYLQHYHVCLRIHDIVMSCLVICLVSLGCFCVVFVPAIRLFSFLCDYLVLPCVILSFFLLAVVLGLTLILNPKS